MAKLNTLHCHAIETPTTNQPTNHHHESPPPPLQIQPEPRIQFKLVLFSLELRGGKGKHAQFRLVSRITTDNNNKNLDSHSRIDFFSVFLATSARAQSLAPHLTGPYRVGICMCIAGRREGKGREGKARLPRHVARIPTYLPTCLPTYLPAFLNTQLADKAGCSKSDP